MPETFLLVDDSPAVKNLIGRPRIPLPARAPQKTAALKAERIQHIERESSVKTANTAGNSDLDVQTLLQSRAVARKTAEFKSKEIIFSQGDASSYVMYIQKGSVKLSAVSSSGKE